MSAICVAEQLTDRIFTPPLVKRQTLLPKRICISSMVNCSDTRRTLSAMGMGRCDKMCDSVVDFMVIFYVSCPQNRTEPSITPLILVNTLTELYQFACVAIVKRIAVNTNSKSAKEVKK